MLFSIPYSGRGDVKEREERDAYRQITCHLIMVFMVWFWDIFCFLLC